MSNDFSGRVWTLDSAFSTALTDKYHVTKMIWEPSAAAESLIVKDKNGLVLWNMTSLAAAADAGPEVYNNPDPRRQYFDGFDLDTITASGILRVYLQ